MNKSLKLTALYKEKGDILNTMLILNQKLSEARMKLAQTCLEISNLESDNG